MFNKRSFRYGSNKSPVDTVLSVIMGIIGWISFIFMLASSIATAGTLSDLYGYFYIVTFVVALWGSVFSIFSWRNDEGTLGIKRMAIIMNFLLMIAMVALVVIYFI